MSLADEDALVLALWRWFRGREDADGLAPIAKVVYSMRIDQLIGSEHLRMVRSKAGAKGNLLRWGANRKMGVTGASPTATAIASAPTTVTSSTSNEGRFKRPAIEEIREYCDLKGYKLVDPVRFNDYYESIGWFVGKKPMKDWKAAVRMWYRKEMVMTGGVGRSAAAISQEGYVLRFGVKNGQEGAK